MKHFLLFVTCFYLVACAGKDLPEPSATFHPTESERLADQKAYEGLILTAKTELEKAKSENLYLYAPIAFRKAEIAYHTSKSEIENDPFDVSKTARLNALEVSQQLTKARETKKLTLKTLKQSFEYYHELIKLSQQIKITQKQKNNVEFAQLTEDLIVMVQLVEAGTPKEAVKLEKEFFEKISDTEKSLLKQLHLSNAASLIEQSLENDADELASKTLLAAQQSYRKAESFIEKHYRDRSEVEALSSRALNDAERLYRVTEDARTLLNLDTDSVEGFIISLRSDLDQIESIVSNSVENDSRALVPLSKQLKQIKERLKGLKLVQANAFQNNQSEGTVNNVYEGRSNALVTIQKDTGSKTAKSVTENVDMASEHSTMRSDQEGSKTTQKSAERFSLNIDSSMNTELSEDEQPFD